MAWSAYRRTAEAISLWVSEDILCASLRLHLGADKLGPHSFLRRLRLFAARLCSISAMAHSVSGHLKLKVDEYDDLIRKLVPAYPAMRPVQLELLALGLPANGVGLVLDLGGGTGALAAAIAARFPRATVEIWDTDPEMLT